jgi:hypothetical protein
VKIVDPFLASAITKEPKLEKTIYELLLKLNSREHLIDFLGTPAWVLSQLYEQSVNNNWEQGSVLGHPNCERKLIDSALNLDSGDLLHGLVHNPKLTSSDLRKIMASKDEMAASWAKFYLFKDKPEAEPFILSELSKQTEDRDFILSHFIAKSELTSRVTSELIKNHIHETASKYSSGETIGDVLTQNPHLSPETRVELHLLGFTRKNEKFHEERQYPSTFLFVTKMNNLEIEDYLLEKFISVGHPCGLLFSSQSNEELEFNEINLFQLINSEFLHRALWRELVGYDGFSLTFRNGYRVSDFFIEHKTLGKEFQESDFEEGWACGGVLPGYIERKWVEQDIYIPADRAASIFTNQGDSFIEVTEYYELFSEMYPAALAFFSDEYAGEELLNKYGVTLNESASPVIEAAALEQADQEDLDIDISLNLNFSESLSWNNLPIEKKIQICEFLIFGLDCENQKLKKDAEHFLGCIALHPKTPTPIVDKLMKLNNQLISATLSRHST